MEVRLGLLIAALFVARVWPTPPPKFFNPGAKTVLWVNRTFVPAEKTAFDKDSKNDVLHPAK